MWLFLSVWATVALGAEIKLDVEVHGHTTQHTFDAVAPCVEQRRSFTDDQGSWSFDVVWCPSKDSPEDEGRTLGVQVSHTCTEHENMLSKSTFEVNDGNIATLRVGDLALDASFRE